MGTRSNKLHNFFVPSRFDSCWNYLFEGGWWQSRVRWRSQTAGLLANQRKLRCWSLLIQLDFFFFCLVRGRTRSNREGKDKLWRFGLEVKWENSLSKKNLRRTKEQTKTRATTKVCVRIFYCTHEEETATTKKLAKSFLPLLNDVVFAPYDEQFMEKFCFSREESFAFPVQWRFVVPFKSLFAFRFNPE